MQSNINTFTEYKYKKYILNYYNNTYYNALRYVTPIRCQETELPVFKKLKYTYYPSGSLGGDIDEDVAIQLYCVGYNLKTIPNLSNETDKWMPVYNSHYSHIRSQLNYEFHQKYKLIRFNKIFNIIKLYCKLHLPSDTIKTILSYNYIKNI